MQSFLIYHGHTFKVLKFIRDLPAKFYQGPTLKYLKFIMDLLAKFLNLSWTYL